MIHRHLAFVLLLVSIGLASCGGGTEPADPPVTRAASAAAAMRTGVRAARPTQQRALAAAAATPEDAANQLMDFAEVYYPQYFPGHPATGSALGYLYRYYDATGIYLGVRDGQVYVLGGVFGGEVVAVGPLAQFITPRARSLSTLCTAPGAAYGVYATPDATVGKNVALTVGGCSGTIDAPQWRQTAGPTLVLPSDKTQTISFDPVDVGSYAFQLSFTDPSGVARSESVTLDAVAAAPGATRVTLRASLSVRMGGKVSVRAWPTVADGDAVKAVKWTQIEGPAVELDTRTSRLVLFTAPQVSRDTVIRLRATLYTDKGQTDSDDVLILVERYSQAPASDGNALWGGDHVSRVYAYKPDSPYAGALRRCVYDAAIYAGGPKYNLCSLASLPFIGQETAGGLPTIEQVMNHVVVSHDWLGRNFETFLRVHDTRGDFRRMLNSVTAIVLGTEVRPSFYFAGTGAIYLDGDSFWLTAEERDTMNEAADYRSEFGNGLQYDTLWRYVLDGRNLYAFFDPRERITRSIDDVRNEAVALLYHELSHALDYVPPAAYPGLVPRRSVLDNITPRYNNFELTSDQVPAAYPLMSNEMVGLAQVNYRGSTASAEQKAYTPLQVAGFFSADVATDDYAYTSQFEDIAMTQEELLMQRRLNILRDTAISDVVATETGGTSTSFIVRWGQRGRVGEIGIRPRARAIAQALVPWFDDAEVDLLAAPIALRAGESWSANLTLQGVPRGPRALNARPSLQEQWQQDYELQRMQKRRHGPGKRLPLTARPVD
ncbi:MAG: hypothetical protein HY021_08915 [Burkholderiales bacterium]|nr:hypothetical protein [Burkholderiales bacterium]